MEIKSIWMVSMKSVGGILLMIVLLAILDWALPCI